MLPMSTTASAIRMPGQERLAGLQRVERRRAVAHPVRRVGAVGDEVDAELAARRLDGGVGLARGRAQDLGHLGGVVALGQPVDALADDAAPTGASPRCARRSARRRRRPRRSGTSNSSSLVGGIRAVAANVPAHARARAGCAPVSPNASAALAAEHADALRPRLEDLVAHEQLVVLLEVDREVIEERCGSWPRPSS